MWAAQSLMSATFCILELNSGQASSRMITLLDIRQTLPAPLHAQFWVQTRRTRNMHKPVKAE